MVYQPDLFLQPAPRWPRSYGSYNSASNRDLRSLVGVNWRRRGFVLVNIKKSLEDEMAQHEFSVAKLRHRHSGSID